MLFSISNYFFLFSNEYKVVLHLKEFDNSWYEDFLIERRKLMASKIKQAFEILKNNTN